ncbi:AAA family ATPase [Limosilactobacillus fastidiosus]|uniref:AAA family ATPase n=2 Tax=Limosilactobacillus fastidiosus TaxID=2759855 RepID=A0A7W3U0D9_9LACO|nr:RNA polymerase recycling motor HelD [Limosilactobacillus fastidiosus]MBB1086619.1 AAA family ATPase [Limosilactobacillus fastidiosus]MCD7086594.1 AAA family ATPase [Limosilactobacillus fastidiosus]MCD7115302.1 AAA family ATPase [Limosilactobacillus fastidiosus]MCD7116959.1 AAA family ATPase [Limosilactobacillus fastidiosus]
MKQIDKQITETKKALADAHQETRAVEKNYSENASINRYEIDDIAESRAMIEQQRQLVSRAVESETILRRQLKTLQNLKRTPYFGRIDIQDPGKDKPETLYIGTASLMNDDKTAFLIYDWRAPISGVYYNGTLGEVRYETPNGNRETILVKKRQFTIKDGRIINMFDTNETVGDELLQAALGEQNDQYMHNIVATIQQEQNDIIRDTHSDLLLVQGVAGSGKTSAILQRIAYLLYHSRTALNADQIVLFSPNRLFSHYISQVLPSLGERNMRQVTMSGFVRRRFEGLQVENIFERYEKRQRASKQDRRIADLLESKTAMHDVHRYTTHLLDEQLQFSNITFEGRVFFTAEHIQSLYRSQPNAMKAANRMVQLKNQLIRELQRRVKVEAKKDWVAKELDSLDTQQLHNLYGKKSVDDFKDEDEQYAYLAYRWAKRRLRIVADAIYNDYFIDIYSQYASWLRQLPLPDDIQRAEWEKMIANYDDELELHRLEMMHAAPLMYLRDLLMGTGQNHSFKYVFIDEMQDYSVAMMMYLRHAFPGAKFTVLGDSEQALFKPLELPEKMLERLSNNLAAKHPNLISLRRSYRSTKEITDFAKSLLPDGEQIMSFTRHGERPALLVRYSDEAVDQALQMRVGKYHEQYETVAVLTKNQEQAQKVYRQLRRQFTKVHLLDMNDTALPDGILGLPVYLAKGLEFDSVIAYDVSQTNLRGTDEVGMIYTMATRAMHALTMISNGKVSPAINEKASQQLTIEHELTR